LDCVWYRYCRILEPMGAVELTDSVCIPSGYKTEI
jgi:hypothetical protein